MSSSSYPMDSRRQSASLTRIRFGFPQPRHIESSNSDVWGTTYFNIDLGPCFSSSFDGETSKRYILVNSVTDRELCDAKLTRSSDKISDVGLYAAYILGVTSGAASLTLLGGLSFSRGNSGILSRRGGSFGSGVSGFSSLAGLFISLRKIFSMPEVRAAFYFLVGAFS